MLIIYGILFIIVENRNKGKESKINSLKDITFKTAVIIGIFQVLALIPGTSRSGATILGAILIGTSRNIAAEFTFFLAIPVMVGASLYKLLKFVMSGAIIAANEYIILAVGMITAFIVSILAIKFLMNYIKKNDFKSFGIYRIVLGILVVALEVVVAFLLRPVMYVAFDADFARSRGVPVASVSYIMAIFVALAIVFCIRSVGIVLLISLLTVPAVIVNTVTQRFGRIMLWASVVAVVGNMAGLYISYVMNVPAGAATIFIFALALIIIKLLHLYFRNKARTQ